jgi:DNA-binding transcriptional LysR family regulator
VAAPEYLSRHGPMRRRQALNTHAIVVTDAVLSRRGTLTLCTGRTSVEVPINPSLRTNNARVLLESLKDGCGIGPVQVPLVTGALQTGHLIRVLPRYEIRPSELYITYPTSRFLRPAVRAFVDFVVPALRTIEGIS